MHQKIFIFAACLVFAAVASGCVKHRSSPRAPIINVGSEANAFSLFDIGITNPAMRLNSILAIPTNSLSEFFRCSTARQC